MMHKAKQNAAMRQMWVGIMFKKKSIAACALIAFLACGVTPFFCRQDNAALYNGEICEDGGGRVENFELTSTNLAVSEVRASAREVRVGSRIFELFFGKKEEGTKALIPSGDVFGARMQQRYVSVTESTVPTIAPGTRITEINGRSVSSVKDILEALGGCDGGSVTLTVEDKGTRRLVEIMPRLVDGEYRIGLTLRDAAAGIGTITFIDPDTGAFGGLGHGICDSESGEVIETVGGDATGVILGGLHRGEAGKPGELCGVLTDERIGELYKNDECGVFGVIKNGEKLNTGTPIPIGGRDEVHVGEATIISTVKSGRREKYKIEITEIDRNSTGSKSYRIRVTDPMLIALTGGIVRGMSGSPIIQDGKLVGAVTHVMVADPTEGYGIFIENMLNASVSTRNELPRSA